jgi:hypothetical protein
MAINNSIDLFRTEDAKSQKWFVNYRTLTDRRNVRTVTTVKL